MSLETVILDTNIISYLMNGHSFALGYRRHMEGRQTAISFMTVAELYEGAFRRGWSANRVARMEAEIGRHLVIPYSQDVAVQWGRIRSERRAQPISVDDAWIAATAMLMGCPLLTHNPRDFEGIGGLQIVTEHAAG